VQDAEDDGAAKAQLMKTHWRSFPGANNRRAVLWVFVEIEVPDANQAPTVEGLVHVSSLKDDWYEYRARQQALFGRKTAPPTGWVIA